MIRRKKPTLKGRLLWVILVYWLEDRFLSFGGQELESLHTHY